MARTVARGSNQTSPCLRGFSLGTAAGRVRLIGDSKLL